MAEVMSTVRNISTQLRPSALDHFGLVPAITFLNGEVEKQSGINIHAHTSGMQENVSAEKELALYRIVQESLNNAVKAR
jgi:two-component system sensor histidine kinase NreB